jgi:DNA (cytosine-5)-methyltransferase 1
MEHRYLNNTRNDTFIEQGDEIIVDNFSGGGGASSGIERGFRRLGLKRKVAIAINHDPEALAMHAANHPGTIHFQEDVYDVRPEHATRNRPIGLAWFSPSCTHFSKAKGGKPREQKIRGLAWVTLKWAALKCPRVIALENVVEFADWGPLLPNGNPDKTQKGRTFKAFVDALSTGIAADHPDLAEIHDTLGGDFPISRLFTGLGYKVEWRALRACDYGAPTIRKRLFLIARCDGLPITWPSATHGSPKDDAVKAGQLAPWRTAAECIDFSIPCPSIFERKRPLAEATLRRIARGLQKFVIGNPNPFIVNVANSKTAGRAPNAWSADEPLRTVTASPGFAVVEPRFAPFISTYYGDKRPTDVRGVSMEMPIGTQTTENRHAPVSATLVQTGYGERAGQEPRAPGLDKPLGTVVAGGAMTQPIGTITSVDHDSKVAVHLTKFRSGSVGSAMDEPLHTLTAGGEPARPSTGNVMGLVAASLIHMGHGEASKNGAPRWSDGTRDIEQPLNTVTASGMPAAVVTSNLVKLRGDNIGSAADQPLHTISAQGQHHAEVRTFLVKYYGSERNGASCNDPMHTVRSNDCFGLVYIKGEAYEIADIGLRMLTPRELARAQGFPDAYILDCEVDQPIQRKLGLPKTTRLSKTAQVRMIGNSVCPDLAAAVIAANFTHEVELAMLEVA